MGSLQVKLDGAVAAVKSGDTLRNLSDGVHTVSVTVADLAGNATTATTSFTIGKTTPIVTLTSPNVTDGGRTSYNRPVFRLQSLRPRRQPASL